MNLCEGEIRELKRGSTRKLLKRNVPKKLWDHCLELESRIHSATTLPFFDLDHQTPEAKMHGISSDISDICEFEFMNGLCLMTHGPFSLRLSFRWDDG